MKPSQLKQELELILTSVQKPGRYTGGEFNQIVKDWGITAVKVALAFPEIYDLGMSNLGVMILYDLINKDPRFLAERVFVPWIDMEKELRDNNIPLFSLENKVPVEQFKLCYGFFGFVISQ